MNTPRPSHSSALSRRGFAAAAIVSAATFLSACAVPRAPSDALPLALVYGGPQGCADCAPTIATVLRSGPRPFRVRFVGPGTPHPISRSALDAAALYVQPGGGADLDATWRDLRPSADAIRSWVHDGGSFLGLCFGAYLAGSNPGLDLLPGDTFGWAGSAGASVPDDRDTVVPVTWRGRRRHMYFQDGPGFALDRNARAEVLGQYPDGVPAALVASFGAGRVGVSGPHPEADRSWFEAAGLRNPDGYRLDLARDLITTTCG
ncbi:BPL-N domain-containing protein [Curtobacterium poinsettiae]|uniref:BPL-N domain-containing protein n=1 Tax=Curtobacterium poinsettiae TaxID=159612 RepID=UPI0021C64C2F|nr:BPL-N domain-containing protein [Curtobacterium flaccumfaciens]MCU0151849.1 BPL-N domain-containing protein [Curtobacterium flaccumfaciens pv. poinsettiae]UXN16155.1 BPL-N domain-containing protein [Curtobacterium flaccumfaciens pv. poinsettiae]